MVHLSKARIANRAVSRYLDTRYFDSAIQTLRTRQVRKQKAKGERRGHDRGVQLRFTFKKPADLGQAASRVVTEADGFSYVYLDFARSTDMPELPTTQRDRLQIDE